MHPLPYPIQAPGAEVVVDGLPGWEVVRQQAPGAAATDYVEDGVKDLPQGMYAWSARRFGGREVILEICPIGIGKIS